MEYKNQTLGSVESVVLYDILQELKALRQDLQPPVIPDINIPFMQETTTTVLPTETVTISAEELIEVPAKVEKKPKRKPAKRKATKKKTTVKGR
jgi:hypothetical protein